MNDPTQPESDSLSLKLARLFEERGWNQGEVSRLTGLNRQTVWQIFQPHNPRRLRNATVSACARVLGLSVSELRTQPLDQLLPRMHVRSVAEGEASTRRLYEEATQPQLLSWIERNPERARQLSREEIDELLSLQGTGGPLSYVGVEHYVGLVERKRNLIRQIHDIAGTEYIDLLEKLVQLLHEKIQPYGDRK